MIPFLKFLEFVRVVKSADKYSIICILMVSSGLRITSQVEHTKKYNSIDSESKSVKQNADNQNRLAMCFFMLLLLPYSNKILLA